VRAALPLSCLVLLGACGGSGDGDPRPTPSSTPPASTNPCTTALAAFPAAPAAAAASSRAKEHGGLGQDKRDPREILLSHRAGLAEGRVRAQDVRALATGDVSDVAVIQDDGSLIANPNPFDLAGQGLRFSPNAEGGYDVAHVDATFRPSLGTRLTLADDDTFSATIPFTFRYFGRGHTGAFVNSDGNITFGAGDVATDERGLTRLLSGAPRVAPFFADLDPSTGGGVFVASGPDAVTVTWCSVRGFESSSTVTSQASLLPDGSVEIKFENVTLGEGIVALSPGETGTFAPVDLRASGTIGGGAAAVGERFASSADLDLVAAGRAFYEGHSDSYDQLVFWTDTGVVTRDTFAFETTVRNAIQGLGTEIVDFGGQLGSAGALESLVVMDNLGKYPADPAQRIVGENSTLALLGHESGHRWLATLLFRDASGASSDALLGRQRAHWSFFFDSDASFLEGNDIEDLGGGSFRTTNAVARYGPLDLYAMGLIEASEVPPSFLVEGVTGATQDRETAPRTGVTFSGRRRDLAIGDVVAALGPRTPPASAAPRLHRQAFVYVVGRGRAADQAAIDKLSRIRAAWEPFFAAATGGRMAVETHLR
jgi:hypothetical protein